MENTKGKVQVVLYESDGAFGWDTAYVGYFRGQYSLVLDRDYSYQVWFTNSLDSVKVLTVDRRAVSAKSITVDVDFNRKGCARVVKSRGKHPFDLLLLNQEVTIVNKPEDLKLD
jgi:hypothetical protein